jgi:hypothetical protein
MILVCSLYDNNNRHNRYLRDFHYAASNHTKQHYTYQYMSYSDSSSDHSITTSVSIRVTPLENYFVSWGILWSGFVIASIIASWQVYREQRIFHLRHAAGKITSNATSILDDDNNNGAVDVALGDSESVSTADLTRSMVRVATIRLRSKSIVVNFISIYGLYFWHI